LWRWSVRILVAAKQRLEQLVQQRTSELIKEKAKLLKARATLEELATRDALTGLLNRGSTMRAFEREIERPDRESSPLAIVFWTSIISSVDDTYGHVTGDCVLQEYEKRLRSAARPDDIAGRYGGEELVMILPNFPKEGSGRRLSSLHASLCSNTMQCNGHQLDVTCSIGVAWYETGADSIQTLIERVDRAMYRAKKYGRNRVELG
jgi:diguanylate cyclase (GGDEF)-like protein